MARLNNVRIQEDPSDTDDDDLYAAPERTSRDSRNTHSSSSDKENTAAKTPKGRKEGGSSSDGGRLAEIDPTQALHNQILEEEGDRDAYDPDQDPEERRQVKKQYRELQRKLQGTCSPFFFSFSFFLFSFSRYLAYPAARLAMFSAPTDTPPHRLQKRIPSTSFHGLVRHFRRGRNSVYKS